MILRCHPREILGLVDEIKRLRERLAAVDAACLDLMGRPYWLKAEALAAVRNIARGVDDRG